MNKCPKCYKTLVGRTNAGDPLFDCGSRFHGERFDQSSRCYNGELTALKADLAEARRDDLVNTWCRESCVEEAKDPFASWHVLRDAIDRIWSHWSSKNAELRARIEKLEEIKPFVPLSDRTRFTEI